ncbi:MAG: ATP-binding protein [Kiritimatiellaeota bacterium]|nr:ATP-binding protein [Kiritimatiellota bacterium]
MKTYIHRDLEPVLRSMLKQFPAVALTGPRQAGKSTLLQYALPTAHYLTLDDPVLRQRALDDPELMLGTDAQQLIIDEIQYAPTLLSYIKIRIDKNRAAKGCFILTGSQQFALMKNLVESLAGRIGLLELMPFGVAEAARAGASSEALAAFSRACLRGSFPEPLVDRQVDVACWYAAYVQTYLERDIRTVYDIGNLREFERFLQLLAARCAQELHLSTLAADVGVAVNTIKNWVSILEACRIIYLLPPYYRNLGKRIIKAPKVYFMDIGMVCYLTGLRDKDHLLNGPLSGPLFENFCIQEALKVLLSRGVPPRLYFLRTQNGLEVDLLVEGVNGRLWPFEFKFSRTPRPSMGDALTSFREQFKTLRPEPGGLVTLSAATGTLTRDVQLCSLEAFLSAVKSLAHV